MALDNFRKVNITLNKANQHILEPQIAKVGDVNGRELVVQLIDSGVIKDQTGVSLTLNWQHANGNQGSERFGVIDAEQGLFNVYYPEKMLYRGTVIANISINESGKITNSLNFQIIVEGDVFDGSAVEVDGVLFTLKDLKEQIEQKNADLSYLNGRQSTLESQFDAIQQELTDTDFVSAPEIIAARDGHETLNDRLVSDMINPSFSNSETQVLGLGNELVDGSKAILGTGWTLSGSTFTHTAGNSAPLTIPLNNISSGNQYQIAIGVTNPASGPGGQSDFWLSLGGTKEFETYDGGSSQYKYVIYAGDTNDNLVIRPWSDYAGAITVSVKQITGNQLKPFISLYDFENKVASEMRFGKQGTDSLYIGYNSGRWSPDGYRNTAMGNIAMSRMTTGFWNTATGYGTLQENTVGTRNVALGYIALRNNISGDRNIGIGSFALTNLKTGRNNVAIGVDTYYHATQGDGNIAIGLLALATNPHSEFNIAIGNNSMSGSNGGTGNVALGNDTLRGNRGLGNVALGDKALGSNTSGSHNVAVGINSLRYGSTGTYNIALGENSGMYMEGTQNIAIGRRTASNLGEGTKDNIALGYLTLDKATGGTENIAIGSGAMSRNAVDVGLRNVAIGTGALRWADGAEGNVGIGQGALLTTQSGCSNVAIGYQAGDSITTGSDNIVIGSLISVPSPTANKQLNIGDAITSDNYETGTIDFRKIKLTALPTSKPSKAGTVWNDAGTLKIA